MHKTITGLIPDTLYGVQVRAVNGSNVSEWSPLYEFNTANDNNAAPAVTNVTITVVADTFHIEWDRMGNNVNNHGSPIVRYDLELIGNTYLSDGISVVQGSTSRIAWTMTFSENLTLFLGVPRATVKVRVRAVDANGTIGDWSDQVEATNPPPGPVTSLVATGITDGVNLTWLPPADDDLIGYRVYAETSGPTFTPQIGLNDVTFTPALSYFFESILSAMWYFVVVAVDKFGSESTILSRAQAESISRFNFDTDAPPPPENVAGVITTEDVTLETRMHVTWTYDALPDGPPDDLASFQARYRPVGDIAWLVENVPVNATDLLLETTIESLEPYYDYDLQMRARDFIGNSSDWTANVVVPQATNTAPSKPSAPTAVGNTQHIQVVHSGLNFEGYPLEEDVAFLEVYANTSGTAMSYPTDYTKVLGSIAFGPGMVQTFNIPAGASSGNSQQWYVSLLAVDRGGLRSSMSDIVPVAVGLIDTLNVSDAAITNAKIFNLDVNKLTAGTGIINDLTVKSTLTMGDASTVGYIKSYDWVSGTTGWRIGKGTFEVNGGTISAGALQIQDSAQNIMPLAYSDFQWLDYYYTPSTINWRGQNGLYLSAGAADAGEPGGLYNRRYLRIYSLANTDVITARFTTQANGANGYNISVEEGAQYIVSGYFQNKSASSCTWNLQVVGDVSGTPTTLLDQSNVMSASQSAYTRYQAVITIPTGCNRIVVGVKNVQNDRAKDLWLDGFQVERVMAGKTTASPWKPPGSTTIEGAGITTGFLRSSSNINVNGVDQPLWYIDINGIAAFGDAQVRGRLIVGDTAGLESDSYISSGNFNLGLNRGWKIDGTGNAFFAHIDLNASDGSGMQIGRLTDPYTSDISSGILIYAPSGVVLSDPTMIRTRWYTHADFGQGAEVQIVAPKRHDWGGTPSHIYLGSYSSTTTTDIDIFATHIWQKSLQFQFADNSGNRVEFTHRPTVGGADDGFAFVGSSSKKIVFDFNASNNKIISMDGSSNKQVLYINTEHATIDASEVAGGPSSLFIGDVGGRLGLHNGESGGSGTVALYYGLDSGGFGSLKATNFAGTVNRKFEAQAFVVTSDESLKKNQKVVSGALDKINDLIVYDYDFNMGEHPTARAKKADLAPGRGIIAQEIEATLPEVVETSQDGSKGIDLYALLGTTIAAVQELSSRLDALESR